MTSSKSHNLILFPQQSQKFEIMADASMAPVAPTGPEITGVGNDQQHPPADPSPEIREPVIGPRF